MMVKLSLSISEQILRFYYSIVLIAGKILKKLMWKIIELKNNGSRIHPKHIALPNEHHHWYAEQLNQGWNVLDLGCDRGGHVRQILNAKGTVIGIEKSYDALLQAYKSDGVCYVRGDLENRLPFKSNIFDAVLTLDIIEHLHKRDQFLSEISRVIKPGGTVFLSAPNRATKWKTTARRLGFFKVSDPDHKIEYEKGQLINSIKKHDLEIIDIAPIVFDTPFDGWIDFLGAVSTGLYRWAWMKKRAGAIANPLESTGFRLSLKCTKSE